MPGQEPTRAGDAAPGGQHGKAWGRRAEHTNQFYDGGPRNLCRQKRETPQCPQQ